MKSISAIVLLLCLCKFSPGQVNNLNAIFKASKGTWECPVKSGYIIDRSALIDYHPSPGINILCDSFSCVHAVFGGKVILVNQYDSIFMIVVKYGDCFIGYSNLFESCVKKGDSINTGDVIGYTAKNLDGVYGVDVDLSILKKGEIVDIDPVDWFKDKIPSRSYNYKHLQLKEKVNKL